MTCICLWDEKMNREKLINTISEFIKECDPEHIHNGRVIETVFVLEELADAIIKAFTPVMVIEENRVTFNGPDYPKIVRYHQGLRVLTAEAFNWLDNNYYAEMSLIGDGSEGWKVVLEFASRDGAEAFVRYWGEQ